MQPKEISEQIQKELCAEYRKLFDESQASLEKVKLDLQREFKTRAECVQSVSAETFNLLLKQVEQLLETVNGSVFFSVNLAKLKGVSFLRKRIWLQRRS